MVDPCVCVCVCVCGVVWHVRYQTAQGGKIGITLNSEYKQVGLRLVYP
jgi:hypothetical protein